jgi:hypothetical protein
LRLRARAMNRRAELGTASVSARTNRQFRPPPLVIALYCPSASVSPSASV